MTLCLPLEECTREEVASDRNPERVSQTGDSCGRAFPAEELRPLFLEDIVKKYKNSCCQCRSMKFPNPII